MGAMQGELPSALHGNPIGELEGLAHVAPAHPCIIALLPHLKPWTETPRVCRRGLSIPNHPAFGTAIDLTNRHIPEIFRFGCQRTWKRHRCGNNTDETRQG